MRPFSRLIATCCILGLTIASASAEDAWPERVGRVSLAEAGAGLRPSGGGWSNAVVNEPVAAGTALRTGAAGRAEIRLAGVVLALAPATAIDIVRLDNETAQVALKAGQITLSLDRRGQTSGIEIDTAQGAVRPAASGRYDIDAGAGLLSKTAAADAGAVVDRVPATMPGAAALAAAGDWDESADGPVWYPHNLPADWVPFRYGSWRFLPPWGWTWIDAAAWGFAPSHYGRWARIPGSSPATARWGWLPGAGAAERVFAPATVAFLGTPGIGLSYAGGAGPAVAWFPLAPGETYWPANKGAAPAEAINAAYRNRRFASAVPRAVFANAKPVAAALVDIPGRRLDVAPVIPGSPQIPAPAPRLVAALPPIAVVHAVVTPPPIVATLTRKRARMRIAAHWRAPVRIALDAPRQHPARPLVAARRPHIPPPIRLAIAPTHPLRRHVAEARHILRQ